MVNTEITKGEEYLKLMGQSLAAHREVVNREIAICDAIEKLIALCAEHPDLPEAMAVMAGI